jgi:hypothetical protein
MTERPILDALAGAWADMLDAGTADVIPGHCVLGTRLAVRVLDAFDVEARPFPSDTFVYNAEGWRLSLAGVPVDQWPAGAHSIGACQQSPGTGYAGHLWARTADHLVDLSARQFDRPGRLHFPQPLIVPLVEGQGRDGGLYLTDERGQVVLVYAGRDRSYRNAGEWREHWRRFAPELYDRTAARLAAAEVES